MAAVEAIEGRTQNRNLETTVTPIRADIAELLDKMLDQRPSDVYHNILVDGVGVEGFHTQFDFTTFPNTLTRVIVGSRSDKPEEYIVRLHIRNTGRGDRLITTYYIGPQVVRFIMHDDANGVDVDRYLTSNDRGDKTRIKELRRIIHDVQGKYPDAMLELNR